MVMAFSLLLTVRLRHAIIYYDAETDAASLQHDYSPPGKNSAVISIGRELRKLVERRGTTLHWVKVLGHSDDVINDRADELATDGMDGKKPRQLKPQPIIDQAHRELKQREGESLQAS